MDDNAKVTAWLKTFEKLVRERNFESAKLLYKKSPVLFGTRVEHSNDIDYYSDLQWSKIWNHSQNFTIKQIVQLGTSEPISFAAVLWTNSTLLDGIQVERSGRASFVFEIEDGAYKAIHSHFSESPKNELEID